MSPPVFGLLWLAGLVACGLAGYAHECMLVRREGYPRRMAEIEGQMRATTLFGIYTLILVVAALAVLCAPWVLQRLG